MVSNCVINIVWLYAYFVDICDQCNGREGSPQPLILFAFLQSLIHTEYGNTIVTRKKLIRLFIAKRQTENLWRQCSRMTLPGVEVIRQKLRLQKLADTQILEFNRMK